MMFGVRIVPVVSAFALRASADSPVIHVIPVVPVVPHDY